ncbi:MAG: M28 family peptidase [Clostridiaceae bacterium]|nr:M28 family peptidase [Clostridiaceae bacterium]
MTIHKTTEKLSKISGRFLPMLLVIISLVSISLSACSDTANEDIKPAAYGDYGSEFALKLATTYPNRHSFSYQEKQAGEMIRDELISMGYEVETQNFSVEGLSSQNYIVRIEGEGFMRRETDEKYLPIRKTVVIGAHYDTPQPAFFEPAEGEILPHYNGLQNNASGVAALMTFAKQAVNYNYAYDVVLVFFGASSSNYAGSDFFLGSMDQEAFLSLEVMYCIESIYAGDKLYASSGRNSLEPGKKYEKRRKLYEAYDVVYDNMLNSKNGVDLLYNMSGAYVDVNGDSQVDIYREVTLTPSDHLPFDAKNVPVVFIESYDYNFPVVEQMKETKNLNLQRTGGFVRGTIQDSSTLLLEEIGKEQLEKRINNVAFILLESVYKGSHNCVPTSSYDKGVRLDPIHTVEVAKDPRAKETESE